MKPQARTKDIITQTTDGKEVLVYDLSINKAFLLNKMSTSVWNLCNGQRDIPTISQILSTSMNEAISEDFVFLAIDQLHKTNLLLPLNEAKELKNLNRRQVIRKIGLTTTIMLPVISSLVVPIAAHAASACNPGGFSDGTRVTATEPTLQLARAAIRAQCLNCKYRSSSNSSGCSDENPSTDCTINATCCSTPVGPALCV